jgi:hypothetical protein
MGETSTHLRRLARDSGRKGHASRLRRALLTLAIPATATLATACYGAPLPGPDYPAEGQACSQADRPAEQGSDSQQPTGQNDCESR